MQESPSLRARLQWLLLLFVAAFIGLAFYQYFSARSLFFSLLEKDLRGDAALISEVMIRDPVLLSSSPKVDSVCKALSRHKGFRITVADSNGRVIGDSHVGFDSLGMVDNHRHRPEFVAAAKTEWGSDHRASATVRMEMVYVAHRLPDGHYLRVAAGPPALIGFRKIAFSAVGFYLLLFVAVALFVAVWVDRHISSPLLRLQAGRPDITKPLRWDASFREAEVLNHVFENYVGEIRRLHANLGHEHDRLIEVLNLLEEGVVLLGPQGEVRTLNASAMRLLPRVNSPASSLPGDWVGRPFSEISPLPELAAFTGSVARGERPPVLLIDKSETCPRDLLCHLRSLSGKGGELLLTLVDISEFRQLDRVKSEFVANASHELKTPLASIRGYAEALIDGALQKEKAREPFVRKILHNALRLESLIGDLLSLSRLEADKGPRNPEPLPLRSYLNQAAVIHRTGLDSAGIRFENHVPEDITLIAEPRDLELIVNNLVGNAIKYNKPGGKVKVSWESLGSSGRLSIKDTGVGIPAEMLPRIFERFYRADASRARQEGTGLGLAIVKHAAQRYHFTVRAESILGEGSRFVVDIPGTALGVA